MNIQAVISTGVRSVLCAPYDWKTVLEAISALPRVGTAEGAAMEFVELARLVTHGFSDQLSKLSDEIDAMLKTEQRVYVRTPLLAIQSLVKSAAAEDAKFVAITATL